MDDKLYDAILHVLQMYYKDELRHKMETITVNVPHIFDDLQVLKDVLSPRDAEQFNYLNTKLP